MRHHWLISPDDLAGVAEQGAEAPGQGLPQSEGGARADHQLTSWYHPLGNRTHIS